MPIARPSFKAEEFSPSNMVVAAFVKASNLLYSCQNIGGLNRHSYPSTGKYSWLISSLSTYKSLISMPVQDFSDGSSLRLG